eukprot:GFUD01039810.1.p1 GENE.GFUD01039810.1~~GFUD01039810.1.p1  ORF type:complete len:101 (-),score=32.33 GFUD01039810.1:50-352(-)
MYGSISASQRASKFREYREFREQEKVEKELHAKEKAEAEKKERQARHAEKDGCSCNPAWYQRLTQQLCHCKKHTLSCGKSESGHEEGFDNVICKKKDVEQ